MNRLEQQFWGQPTAHEKLFIMSVHSHWCPCQRIKLKTPINTHESIHDRVPSVRRFTAVSFSLLTLQSRCFVARNTNSSRSQKHLARQCQRSSTGFARAIIFSTASDQISPTRRIWGRANSSSSRSLAVKTRIFCKSPAFCRIVCRESLIQFSRFHFSFRKYRFLRRLLFFALVSLSLSFYLSVFIYRPRLSLRLQSRTISANKLASLSSLPTVFFLPRTRCPVPQRLRRRN